MQRSQLLYDGLWRCLCPSIEKHALFTAARQNTISVRRPTKLRRPVTSARLAHVRQFRANVQETISIPLKQSQEGGLSETRLPKPWQDRLMSPTPPTEETLRGCTVDEVLDALVSLRDAKRWKSNSQDVDQHQRIVQLVTYLLREEDRPISPFIYECMVDAMADPKGSVDGIRKLLDDMMDQGMKPTAAFCNIALQALMNHPDYVLQQEILGIMREFWFAIETPAKQSVVIGLLRDEQYELAYTRLTELIAQEVRIEPWVYDIFILVFGRMGFFDEMLRLLYRRKDGNELDPMVTNLIYYTLDVCSQAYHHAGTAFAWVAVVRNKLVQPADGIIENVLGTAARHADAQLATEALALISGRTRTLTHHYEAVVEAFASGGDFGAALRILCIMRSNGIRISGPQTRSIYQALKERPDSLGEAEAAVRALAGKQSLPRAIVSVVIEAMAELHGSEAAMELYREMPKLCDDELAGTRIIQELIIHSRQASTVHSLAKDYATRFPDNEGPTRSTSDYGALIAKCAEAGELDLAFLFTKQCMAGGITRARTSASQWVKVLVEEAIAKEDGRIWPVVDELQKSGDEETGRMVQRILQQKRIAMRAAQFRAASQ